MIGAGIAYLATFVLGVLILTALVGWTLGLTAVWTIAYLAAWLGGFAAVILVVARERLEGPGASALNVSLVAAYIAAWLTLAMLRPAP